MKYSIGTIDIFNFSDMKLEKTLILGTTQEDETDFYVLLCPYIKEGVYLMTEEELDMNMDADIRKKYATKSR